MKQVFISYKSEERKQAQSAMQYLERHNISCWMAPRDIPLGSNYAKEIPVALRQCDFFVLILSKKAQQSQWINREVSLAIGRNMEVLPLMLEPCELTDEYTYYLTNVQIYPLYEDKDRVMQEVVQRICQIREATVPCQKQEDATAKKTSQSIWKTWKRKDEEKNLQKTARKHTPTAQALPDKKVEPANAAQKIPPETSAGNTQTTKIPEAVSVEPQKNRKEEPYIFVSYAHRDLAQLMPIITQMKKRGFKVWYDEGIEAGTEWPAFIEDRLQQCEVVLAFISKQSVASFNCRNEIQYALLLRKEVLVVYLENVDLPAGMGMQLSTCRAIYREGYRDTNAFVDAICAVQTLQRCR